MKKIILVIVGALFAMNAFGSDVRSEIEARNKEWTDAFNRGDLKAVSAIYDEGFIAIPAAGEAVTDRAEFEQILAGFKQVATDLSFETISLEVMGAYAYEIGKSQYVVHTEDGSEVAGSDDYLVIWKKGDDGVWNYHVDAWWTSD